MIRILESSSQLIGTSASLLKFDRLTAWELLHGMMLPSGNDAAQSLAIHFGLLLLREKYYIISQDPKIAIEEREHDKNFEILKFDMNQYHLIDERYPDILDAALNEFYDEMNQVAKELKLKNTNFCSAHGMHHDQNYSSAYDIARLSYHCMKNQTFKQLVRT
jgi:D-alanyl-D-alanine carboxypeptidase (penicillin-binding protein 5/6)